jgi:transposase-like protein
MKALAGWSSSPYLTVTTVEQEGSRWLVTISGGGRACCPRCDVQWRSRNSVYSRRLGDLSAQGTPVTIRVRVGRWRCRNERCDRQIFAQRLPGLAAARERLRRRRHAARRAMFDHIRAFYDAGSTVREIARKLGLGRRRVYRWVRRIGRPERNAMAPKPCTPAYFGAFLARRWVEGTTKIRQPFSDIRHRGCTGSYSHLTRSLPGATTVHRKMGMMGHRLTRRRQLRCRCM